MADRCFKTGKGGHTRRHRGTTAPPAADRRATGGQAGSSGRTRRGVRRAAPGAAGTYDGGNRNRGTAGRGRCEKMAAVRRFPGGLLVEGGPLPERCDRWACP